MVNGKAKNKQQLIDENQKLSEQVEDLMRGGKTLSVSDETIERIQALTNTIFGPPGKPEDNLEGRVSVLVYRYRCDGPLPDAVLVDLVEHFITELNRWDARRAYGVFRFIVEHHGIEDAKTVCNYLAKKNPQMQAVARHVWRQIEAWHRIEIEKIEKDTTHPLKSELDDIPDSNEWDSHDEAGPGPSEENLKDVAIPISDVT